MKRGLPVVLLLFAVLRLLPAALGQALPEQEQLSFADGLYSREMYGLAAAEYRRFIERHPESAQADTAWFRLGECLRREGDMSGAEKAFRTVFTTYPQSRFRFRAGFKRADLFMQIGQHDAAAGLFRAVLEAGAPEDIAASSRYFLGEALLEGGDADQAAAAFREVLEHHAASSFRAYALLKLGEISGCDEAGLDLALDLFQQAADEPGSDRVAAEALFQIAEIHYRKEAFDKSAEMYRRLLASYPQDQRAREARLPAAWSAHNAGRYAEALQLAEDEPRAGDDTDEQLAEWLYLKANCERQLMKSDAAMASYSDLVARFPASRFANAAHYEKALTAYRAGAFEQAVDAARGIETVAELREDVYWLLAESCTALERDDEAIQYYRLITRDFPDSKVCCDATYRLAHKLQGRGEYKEAARHYRGLVDRFPTNELAPKALFASAYCLAREELHAEAVRDWSALVERFAAHPLVEESLYQKAMAEIRLERDSVALASLRDLLKRFPESGFSADAHYWQGMLLREAGQLQDAVEQLRLALTQAPRKELEREILFYLAVALQESGVEEEAAGYFLSLLESPLKDRFSPPLLEWLAGYEYGRGRIEDALSAARALVDAGESPSWQQIGWCLIGRGLLEQGDRAGAREALRKSVATGASTPSAAEAALRLGELLLADGEHEEAAVHLRQAAAQASDDALLGVRARAYAALGRAALARRDPAAAARFFMSVAVLFDDAELVPECLYLACEAFTESGDAGAAAKAAAELRTRYPDSAWTGKLPAGEPPDGEGNSDAG